MNTMKYSFAFLTERDVLQHNMCVWWGGGWGRGKGRVCLCSCDWPEIHYVDGWPWTHRDFYVSVSWVLGLKAPLSLAAIWF